MKFDFIQRTKCDINYADKVIEKMKQDGLVLCEQTRSSRKGDSAFFGHDFSSRYNLAKFANLRSYLTMNELGSVSGKRFQIRQQNEKEDKEREEKFISKYGSNKSKWSEEVKEMYENFEDT